MEAPEPPIQRRLPGQHARMRVAQEHRQRVDLDSELLYRHVLVFPSRGFMRDRSPAPWPRARRRTSWAVAFGDERQEPHAEPLRDLRDDRVPEDFGSLTSECPAGN